MSRGNSFNSQQMDSLEDSVLVSYLGFFANKFRSIILDSVDGEIDVTDGLRWSAGRMDEIRPWRPGSNFETQFAHWSGITLIL